MVNPAKQVICLNPLIHCLIVKVLLLEVKKMRKNVEHF